MSCDVKSLKRASEGRILVLVIFSDVTLNESRSEPEIASKVQREGEREQSQPIPIFESYPEDQPECFKKRL